MTIAAPSQQSTQRMIHVTALTAGRFDPSSRFRMRQFIRPLKTLGIDVREYWPLINRYAIEPLPWLVKVLRAPGLVAARSTDITWLGRELVSGKFTLENFAGRKRIFDVDDAIWTPYPSDFSAEIVRHCSGVIAGNRFLSDHYCKLGSQVWLIPTCVDTDVWKPPAAPHGGQWTIGWMGSWSNLPYLQEIEEPLADFLLRHPDCRLLVVSNRRPSFKNMPAGAWDFVPWSTENEIVQTQRMNVGLMPLLDSESSRGKCGFKMLCYMSVGLPVVASPVGVNAEILAHNRLGFAAASPGDWLQALECLYGDRDLGPRMGAAGRAVVEERYSVRANAPKLAGIFRQVAES